MYELQRHTYCFITDEIRSFHQSVKVIRSITPILQKKIPMKIYEDFKKWISKIYYCKIWGLHDWTAKIQQEPDKEIKNLEDIIDSARTYCLKCGKISAFSLEFENELKLIKLNKTKNEERN